MTFEDMLRSAITAQQNGDLEEAGRQFGDILKQAPDHPDALHYFGMFMHQCGKPGEAIAIIERSLEIYPNQPSAFNNLGNLYRIQEREDDADNAFWNAVRFDIGHVEAWRNIAEVRRLREDTVGSIKALRIALAFEPDYFPTNHRLGTLLARIGEFDEAAEIFIAIVRNGVYTRGSVITYAEILTHYGRPEKALELVLEWQKQDPSDPLAAHHVAAHSGLESSGASETYVRETFDGFADTFEGVLKNLGYDAPEVIAQAVADRLQGTRIARAVDLGCGTGLLGPLMKPSIDHLTGVDLSPKMLTRAKDKQVYDELVEGELTGFLTARQPDEFDLVTAAEVLNYIGDLEPVFAAVSRSLKSGGTFIGTFEILEDDGVGYRLSPTGRYEHRQDYIMALAEQFGLQHQETKRIPLRKQFNKTVEGLVITFSTPR